MGNYRKHENNNALKYCEYEIIVNMKINALRYREYEIIVDMKINAPKYRT